jgi:hypothetical protein
MKRLDNMDIIIVLGMAKEGFDWPYREHALTVSKIRTETARLINSFEEINDFYQTNNREPEKNGSIIDKNNEIEAENKKNGIIYVIKSLSSDIKLQKYQNLCKVGFTRNTIDDRAKNATNDSAFLMVLVKVLATYECYNLSAVKLENFLHRFFNSVKLDLAITDSLGDEKERSEWFDIPLNVVEQAINLMIVGEIVNYEHEKIGGKIKLKNSE